MYIILLEQNHYLNIMVDKVYRGGKMIEKILFLGIVVCMMLAPVAVLTSADLNEDNSVEIVSVGEITRLGGKNEKT